MYDAVKFSNIHKQIVEDFIARFPQHYNQLELIKNITRYKRICLYGDSFRDYIRWRAQSS